MLYRSMFITNFQMFFFPLLLSDFCSWGGEKWRYWLIFSSCSITWHSSQGCWEQQNLTLYWTSKSWLISRCLTAHGRGRRLEDWLRCNWWTERARQQPATLFLLHITLLSGVSWWGYAPVSQILWDKSAGFNAVWVQGELWGKPACKAALWVRSLWQEKFYWEMCRFQRQTGRRKAGDHHTGKCSWQHSFPLLGRKAGCTTRMNACIFILASILFLTWYWMPWGFKCPTAARTMQQKPCQGSNTFMLGLPLGTGTPVPCSYILGKG